MAKKSKGKPSKHYITVVVEIRRSSAAGTHGKTKHSRKDRANTKRKALEDQ